MPRFVPRQRKHKVLRRDQSAQDGTGNTNQIEILPITKTEKEQRKQALREELRAGQSRVSGKKQKRLDKYIETKLKKEESLELLKKLSQDRFDTSHLQSSKHLGKRKHEDFVDDQKVIIGGDKKRIVVQERNDSDVDSEDSFEQEHADAFEPKDSERIEAPLPVNSAQTGSGLKKPLELGDDGLPIIQSRKKKRKTKSEQIVQLEEDIPWEGFDSDNTHDDGVSTDLALSEPDDGNSDRSSDLSGSENSESTSPDEDTSSEISSTDSESDGSSESTQGTRPKTRNSAFKAWATEQINKSLGYTPSNAIAELNLNAAHQISQPMLARSASPVAHLEEALRSDRKAYTIEVDRSPAVQAARLELPIVGEEQKIMEAIYNNSIVILSGATGSGKTTQLPQFLFEAGFGSSHGPTLGLIGITQPRRVAAVSMADRVRQELGGQGQKVSYQIRYESTTSNQTAIKFMTDGILLRELSQDLLLKKYSVLVIDEAHERSVNTDILIGMLSRYVVPARAAKNKVDSDITPLKLVIMSATLSTTFSPQNRTLFGDLNPPNVSVEGRQHPVTAHFSRTTQRDYLEEMIRKISKAHRKLPAGEILAFLTGQNEIRYVMNRLRSLLSGSNSNVSAARVQFSAAETPLEAEDIDLGDFGATDSYDDLNEVDIITSDNDEDDEFDIDDPPSMTPEKQSKIPSTAHILPLYSQLPTNEQLRIFEPPPNGSRLIVLATNVAETSLTIPDIRYVFDSGRSKEKVYNQVTGVQSFEIGWISKASAEQRKGRAGRTGPGHCYRLYSSAVFERDFPDDTIPEILRTPVEGVVLQLKGVRFPGRAANFAFPTAPSAESIHTAERLLKNLGALSNSGELTNVGKDLSIYPLVPRLGKTLIIGLELGTISSVISLVAGLTVGDLFIPENQLDMTIVGHQEDQTYTQKDREEDEAREQRKKDYGRARALLSKQDKMSDAVKILTAVDLYCQSADKSKFCEDNFLRPRGMNEVEQLRRQLASMVRANNPASTDLLTAMSRTGSPKGLKEAVAAGFIDQVAIRADLSPNPPEMHRKPKRGIDVPYLPLIPLGSGTSSTLEERAVYIHPSSVLARLNMTELPQYVVYSHVQKSQSALVGTMKVAKARMFPLTAIDGDKLADLARETSLLRYGKPVGQVKVLVGTPKRQECWVVPELGGGNGSVGWPLPPRKVVQVQDLKKGWIVEKFLT